MAIGIEGSITRSLFNRITEADLDGRRIEELVITTAEYHELRKELNFTELARELTVNGTAPMARFMGVPLRVSDEEGPEQLFVWAEEVLDG